MNKFLAIVTLFLVSGTAYAHSHPSVDSLTHSLEHLALNYQAWLPYLLGASLMLAAATVLSILRSRRLPGTRRRML